MEGFAHPVTGPRRRLVSSETLYAHTHTHTHHINMKRLTHTHTYVHVRGFVRVLRRE